MAKVDGRHGYRFVTQTVYAFEQCTITATAYHNAVGGLLADGLVVYLRGLYLNAELLLDNLCKLPIYRIIEAVALEKWPQLRYVALRKCYLRTGKK